MISDFLKKAYEIGKIKDAEEAFVEFPPEEEIHQGVCDYFIKEDITIYSKYKIGDIVYLERFQYENEKTGYNHLFVIIEENNIAVPLEYFAMLISSKIEKLKYPSNISLPKNKLNGLKKDSIVKTDSLYRILDNQIRYKIGTVSEYDIETYKTNYLKLNSKL